MGKDGVKRVYRPNQAPKKTAQPKPPTPQAPRKEKPPLKPAPPKA